MPEFVAIHTPSCVRYPMHPRDDAQQLLDALAWFHSHYVELIKQYPGKLLVLVSNRFVAIADEPAILVHRAEQFDTTASLVLQMIGGRHELTGKPGGSYELIIEVGPRSGPPTARRTITIPANQPDALFDGIEANYGPPTEEERALVPARATFESEAGRIMQRLASRFG